jgi:hypothetical protein
MKLVILSLIPTMDPLLALAFAGGLAFGVIMCIGMTYQSKGHLKNLMKGLAILCLFGTATFGIISYSNFHKKTENKNSDTLITKSN